MRSDNREHEILLFDYYSSLLTKHQEEILNEYYNEDLSMKEIAINLNISKSAVQDLLKRTLKQLYEYEEKLHLIENDTKIKDVLKDMKKENNDLLNKYIIKLNELL